MIYLTKTDEERIKILVNHRKFITIEKTISGTSNVFMEERKVITVLETEQEIILKIQEYEANIIKRALEGGNNEKKPRS